MDTEEKLRRFENQQQQLGQILESVMQQFSQLQGAVQFNSKGLQSNSESLKEMGQAFRTTLDMVNSQQNNFKELVEQIRAQQELMQVLLQELQQMQVKMRGIETENARLTSMLLGDRGNGQSHD